MNINDTFIYHGYVDVSPIVKIMEDNNLSWDEFTTRQERTVVHTQTKTIPIIFDKTFNFNHLNKIPTELYPLFEKEIEKIERIINESVKESGLIIRAILVKLPSKKSIPTHIDYGLGLNIPKRIHIPIQTNEECFFTVGEETKNLKRGELWEINNDKKVHSVENNGDTDRIHLIVDWVSNSDLNDFKK